MHVKEISIRGSMYIPSSNTDEIIDMVGKLSIRKNEVVFILLTEKDLPNTAHLIAELNKRNIDFVGSIFPELISGSKKYATGAIVHIFPVKQKPMLIRDISKGAANLEKTMTSFSFQEVQGTTAFIIIDCMSLNISSFLSSFFNLFANSVEYMGCGAGYLDVSSRKCIFTSEGVFEDAAIISFLDTKCQLSVRHGWQKAIGPIVVTKSEGNIIKELNWKNAFEVYRDIVENDIGKKFDKKDFFETSRHYPFGIYTENHEDLVREVITTNENGYLICAGDVPENAVLNILKSDKANLVNAARNVLGDCFRKGRQDIKQCFVIDCIGRAIFLQEGFEEELMAISNGLEEREIDTIPEGVMSLGEIACMGEDMLEFLNKTIVVGVFHE